MKPKHLALIGAAFLVSLDVLFFILDLTPSGIKLSAPLPGKIFSEHFMVEGHAWHKNTNSRNTIKVIAENTKGQRIIKPAPRDAVKNGGQTLFLLNSFHTDIDLNNDLKTVSKEVNNPNGIWKVTAVLNDEAGRQVLKTSRTIQIRKGAQSREFKAFSVEHLIPALIILLACLTIGLYFRKDRPPKFKSGTEFGIVMVLFVNETIYHIYWYATGGWTVASGLLMQMCGLSILMLIVVFYIDSEKAKGFMFDLIFFWGLGGALQAILAPDIGARGFPDFKYFSFFISHGFIMIGATYVIAGRRYRPTFKSLVIVVLFTNILVVFSYGFNLLLEFVPPYERGNYFITGYPPPTGSIVDLFARVFGPSPRYVIGLELMGLAVFLLLWAPFAIWNRPRAAKKKVL